MKITGGYALKEGTALARVPLFASLTGDELEQLASSLTIIDVPAGTVLIHEGEVGNSFYIVKDGQVEAVKDLGTTNEKILNTMDPGDYLGEMSLLSHNGLRNASIRAVSRARLWKMTQADFNDLLKREPASGYELLKDLSQRLDSTQQLIIEDLKDKNRQLMLAYEELKGAQEQIIEKEKLERELQLAHDIQMSILPAELPDLPGFDFGANIQPARQVGGDLYDFIPLDENRVGILIGDVTDKGVPAAIFMAQVQAFFRAEARKHDSPDEVLEVVNRLLMEKTEHKLFVTVIYGVLDRKTATYTYTRAGHELPILCSSEGEARFMPFSSGQPLGIFDYPLLDSNAITIPPGSAVLLYTDGLTDERNTQKNPFGDERLLDAASNIGAVSAQELCDRLLQTVMDYGGEEPQVDDLTLATTDEQAHLDKLRQQHRKMVDSEW
jgi:serine phosphatase RsbU (regulator of sigma subunit)